MKTLLSLLALLIVTNSCNCSKDMIDNNTENTDKELTILSGNYRVNQIETNSSISSKINISFDSKTGKVSGFAGCNSFFGTYNVEKSTIKFNNIASTKKLCQSEIISLENKFFKVLNSSNVFSIKDNILSLLENETIVLQATKMEISLPGKLKINDNANKVNNETTVKYIASSRGSYQFIQISESDILVSTDRSLIQKSKYNCTKENWEDINSLIEAIDLEILEELEPPSTKHQFDGAPHTTLTVKIGGVEYMTPTFDHGNPPKEIETLVNKVLSLKENAVKQ